LGGGKYKKEGFMIKEKKTDNSKQKNNGYVVNKILKWAETKKK
jgi:hypothetical protein